MLCQRTAFLWFVFLFLELFQAWAFLSRQRQLFSQAHSYHFNIKNTRSMSPPSSPLFFETGQKQQSGALSTFLDTVASLQSPLDGDDSTLMIQILPKTSVSTSSQQINALVFLIDTGVTNEYILAILPKEERVNVTKLEKAVNNLSSSNIRGLFLAPNSDLVNICGFEAGVVPPLGLSPSPIATIVEESLVVKSLAEPLVGGGGLPTQFTLISNITALLDLPNVHAASFRDTKIYTSAVTGTAPPLIQGQENEVRLKPFFAVAPPNRKLAEQILNESSDSKLEPEWVCVVGRISGLRQMARRLVFFDLAPLDHPTDSEDMYPWRNPDKHTQYIAVQLIVGKTFCHRLGDLEGEKALRSLKKGQLVVIQGKTNVGNRDSLKNWVTKSSLDLVVFDIQQLPMPFPHQETAFSDLIRSRFDKKINKSALMMSTPASQQRKSNPNLPVLMLHDLTPGRTVSETVVNVNSLGTLAVMQEELMQWLQDYPDSIALVGVDCEWKPIFLAVGEEQPVLLLQVCVYPLQRIYLMDVQSLLRPLLSMQEGKNAIETAFANIIETLWTTPRFVKVGFHVLHDFQKLAASYPHIPQFQTVESVLEVSQLAMRVMQMKREPAYRQSASSLAKLTELFLSRLLNKQEQTSDWSIRPLSSDQVLYAALDAIVTPHIVEEMIQSLDLQYHFSGVSTRLGRYEDDPAFSKMIKSYRFKLFDGLEAAAVHKLKGKRLVGRFFLVSQSWTPGGAVPDPPSVPEENDSPYTDIQGIVRVPSHAVSVQRCDDVTMSFLIGSRIAKSKQRCVLEFLQAARATSFEDGWQLEYNQRSGYVELENAIVLFVNMPAKGARAHRKYPNEWLEDGSILSWFINDHQWGKGSKRLARTMTNPENTVVLFVRQGKGDDFLCCGRCQVQSPENSGTEGVSQWGIVELHLLLNDWNKLKENADFRDMTG